MSDLDDLLNGLFSSGFGPIKLDGTPEGVFAFLGGQSEPPQPDTPETAFAFLKAIFDAGQMQELADLYLDAIVGDFEDDYIRAMREIHVLRKMLPDRADEIRSTLDELAAKMTELYEISESFSSTNEAVVLAGLRMAQAYIDTGLWARDDSMGRKWV
jgi:hypothetical protein